MVEVVIYMTENTPNGLQITLFARRTGEGVFNAQAVLDAVEVSMTVDAKISHLANNVFFICFHINTRYSAILYRYPTKSVIQEEQLFLNLDTKFS